MKGWHQWCALTAQCHISASEVCNDINSGQCCNTVGVTDLNSAGGMMVWLVIDGLAVGADCRNINGAVIGFFEHCQRRFCKNMGDFIIESDVVR